jgi:hypothetical protein
MRLRLNINVWWVSSKLGHWAGAVVVAAAAAMSVLPAIAAACAYASQVNVVPGSCGPVSFDCRESACPLRSIYMARERFSLQASTFISFHMLRLPYHLPWSTR